MYFLYLTEFISFTHQVEFIVQNGKSFMYLYNKFCISWIFDTFLKPLSRLFWRGVGRNYIFCDRLIFFLKSTFENLFKRFFYHKTYLLLTSTQLGGCHCYDLDRNKEYSFNEIKLISWDVYIYNFKYKAKSKTYRGQAGILSGI